ncbi:MAG: sensor histidine kinase [Oscillospiraceae bacterium]
MFALYRRQVKNTCRRLEFMRTHKTNMRLTSDLPFSDMNRLIDEINGYADYTRRLQSEVLESERSLKEAITNISHDIRTPLTSLDGYFQLLLNCDNEEERQRYISTIRERIDSLKDMLEELFTYAKLQNDTYKLPMERINASKCVIDAVLSYYDDLSARNIEPKISFDEKPFFMNGSEEAVKRIVRNILKNALEHGSGDISLSMETENGSLIFVCSNSTDTPDEIDISQVFGRFYKADSARTHTSSGLGLAIAKGLTEKLYGNISAQLENGLFSVTVVFFGE